MMMFNDAKKQACASLLLLLSATAAEK